MQVFQGLIQIYVQVCICFIVQKLSEVQKNKYKSSTKPKNPNPLDSKGVPLSVHEKILREQNQQKEEMEVGIKQFVKRKFEAKGQ